jgi:putative copper export protein
MHMLATVLWVGSLALLATLVIPIGRRQLPPEDFSNLLHALLKRLDPIAWLCLVTLIATGLVQMTGNQNYDGLLVVDNTWAAAILAKHLVFAGMVGVSAYMTWWILPTLRRQSLIRARGLDAGEPAGQNRKEISLVWINFFLSVLVLALTALARTS